MKRVFLAVLLWVPVTVMAEVVTYEFAGTIDTINFNTNNAFPEGSMGQPFTGWFSYSSDSRTTKAGAIGFSIGSFESAAIDKELLVFGIPACLSFCYYDTQGDYTFGRTGLTFSDASGQAFADTTSYRPC